MRWLIGRVTKRPPDRVIGGEENPYMLRWYILPRNPLLNIYLHHFLRSDDARALHDHPWINASIVIKGEYTEHTIAAGGVRRQRVMRAGQIKVRRARSAHRIELHAGPCWTLFITGPRIREWGFHCEIAGWRHWKIFTTGDGSRIGRGCD